MGEVTLDSYINYCYCKEIAVDRWKGTPSDPHELSERIATMLSLMTANVKSERITPLEFSGFFHCYAQFFGGCREFLC